MKINRISWKNYKGLADGVIEANGRDVVITGKNGAGKSSIASIIPFVLFGKVTGSIRRYSEGHDLPDGLIHCAEVEFENGTRLLREVKDAKTGGGTATTLYVDGEQVKKAAFDAQVYQLTKGGGELVMNPFAFCALPLSERRNFLLKNFSAASESELLAAPENAELKKLLGNKSAASFAKNCRDKVKTLKEQLKIIPAQIDALTDTITEPSATNIGELQAQIDAAQKELSQLQTAERDRQNELTKVERAISQAEYQKNCAERDIQTHNRSLEDLREQWKRLAATKGGTCPTCGQKLPQEKFLRERDAKLTKLNADGQTIKARVEELQKTITEHAAHIESLKARAAELTSVKISEADAARCAELQKNISELHIQVGAAQTVIEANKRIRDNIAELKREEKRLGEEVFTLEGQAALAEDFTERTIEQTEAAVNQNFGVVKFKLFDYLKTTGEFKTTCEATLNGKPFSALSKGEKLIAAMDIFTTLQKKFGVELPLVLDDAESYTAMTLSVVPSNQLFLLKVTDDDLRIEIEERLSAA